MLTLNSQLKTRLEELIALSAAEEDAALKLDCKIDDSRVICDFAAINDLASTFACLSVVNNALMNASTEHIQSAAEALAERINYLPEPLRLIECDSNKEQFQIRSQKPSVTITGICYYELLLGRRTASLTRFAQPGNGRRKVTPSAVTHEVFDRLIADMSAAFK